MTVHDFRSEFPGVDPVVRWCVPNPLRHWAPVKAQGFKGLDDRYPHDYWFPDSRLRYSTSLSYTYDTAQEAAEKVLERIQRDREALDRAEADVRAVLAAEAPQAPVVGAWGFEDYDRVSVEGAGGSLDSDPSNP